MTLGTLASWPLARLLDVHTFLFQVQSTSPVIYALAVAVLGATGLLASAVPAFRAASIDPLVALRRD